MTGQGSVAIDPQKSQYSCGEQVTLTANPAWAGGSMPGAATWKERSPPRPWSWSGAKRHAEFVEDVLQPLAISGVTVTASADSASVNWTTNYPATSRLATARPRSMSWAPQRCRHENRPLGAADRPHSVHHLPLRHQQHGSEQPHRYATRRHVCHAAPATHLVSDDFSAPNLNTSLWTFVNPTGKAALRIVGTGTANARAEISLPSGTMHEAWAGGIVAPAPQQVPNRDFGLTPSSTPTSTPLAIQGVIVQQMPTRTSGRFYTDGSATYLYSPPSTTAR